MSNEQQIAGARAYEELHVPALFREWAEPVLDAASVRRGQRVLDVACGTGVLARAALERVGETGAVTGIDPDPGMLTVADRIQPAITWQSGVAESLPCDDAAFDAVVSQFGMMFFQDRGKAVREMLRVLRDGGCLAVAVWASLEKSAVYSTVVALLDRLAGSKAAEALRAPFVLGDPDELVAIFEREGADAIQVTTRTGTARFPSIRSLVGAELRGWLPLMGVELSEATIEHILEEAEGELDAFVTPEGTVVFDTPALIVSGKRP